MNIEKTRDLIDRAWEQSILPELMDYVRIPNRSPAFDPDWEAHGHMEAAVQLMRRWAEAQALPGAHIEVLRLPGRTPVLMVDVPGSADDCVLMYGHLDKQPEFTGWSDGLDPWTPVLRDGKLYGRGGADDGYALFASLAALRALHEQGVPHARAVVLIEASEESGSPDLEHHIAALGERLGSPTLVVCLDAECGNYEQLWATTSLRGNLIATLRVDVLTEGVHSGTASGVIPSSFRVLREILDRVEDASSGAILVEDLNVAIPPDRRAQARAAADVLGATVFEKFPMPPGMRPVSNDPFELLLNNTWRPTLSVTGADGLPSCQSAGNVLRPQTTLKLSFRLPPTMDT
jgi:acetylornithine deacetylase/succinyl-diaminopimelate desuccinylase-like protein